MTSALHHPFSPQGMVDPYRTLAAFRRVSPAFFDRGMNMWLLTSHELCRAALRDSAFSAAAGQRQRLRDDELPISMLNTDGELHTRLRTPATAPFSARAVGRLTDRITDVASTVLDGLPGPGHGVDVVAEIAAPFAERVLGCLLDLPAAEWPELGRLARAASANLNPLISGAEAEQARLASGRLSDFLGTHSKRRRAAAEPTDLAGLPVEADLDERERLGILLLTVVGGYEPLAIVLATALHLVLDRPEVLDELRDADEDLLLGAVDEALRFESPIPFTARVCTTGFRTTAGVELPADAGVLALLGAANRDPAVFAEPDTFDPHRSPNPHLALGGGAHFCLGAPLVRQSTAIMLGQLLRRRPAVRREPGSRASWRPSLVPRGLVDLPVLW